MTRMITLRPHRYQSSGLGWLAVAVLGACSSPLSSAPAIAPATSTPVVAVNEAGPTLAGLGLGLDAGDDRVVIVTSTTLPVTTAATVPQVAIPTEPVAVVAEEEEEERTPVSLLADALFDADSAILQVAADDELAAVIDGVESIEQVTIVGFTDARGTPEHNLALSEQRAAAVADWFVAHGVESTRISAIGRGEQDATPDATPEQMAADRRVDIVVITA